MTIIASYKSALKADQVLESLIQNGVTRENISVGAHQEIVAANQNLQKQADTGHEHTTKEVVGGAASGAMLTGAAAFLLGASAIAGFPGLLIAGPLAGALTALGATTAVGAAIGSLGGGLTGLFKSSIDEAKAHQVDDIISHGGVMLSVENANDAIKKLIQDSSPESHIIV